MIQPPMNLMKTLLRLGAVAVVLLLIYLAMDLCSYSLRENETAIVTEFGRVTGKPVTSAGLHYKIPFIQTVNLIDTRLQEWDGQAVNMPTGDKVYMTVTSYGRWRVDDPLTYFTSVRDRRTALSRIDDIVGSQIRDAVANNNLIEIVRTDKNRQPVIDTSFTGTNATENPLPAIKVGRSKVESEITVEAKPKLKEFGIELEDVRFKRINYQPAVTDKINDRMASEREKIAKQFLAEGEGLAEQITGQKNRELAEITSEAYKTAQEIKGQAEAAATEIYAAAYNQSPQAVEWYTFLQTMETYKKTLTNGTSIILTTKGDLFKFLNSANPPK
jgi:membrane protease subunit HflC